MRKLLLIIPLMLFVSCGALSLLTGEDGQPIVVDAAGEEVPVVSTTENVGNAIGGIIGVPGLGVGLGALLTAYLASRAKKAT